VRQGVAFTVALPLDPDCSAGDPGGKGQYRVNTPNSSPPHPKSNRQTLMQRSAKPILLVACLSPLLTWNQANAADPFLPDNTTLCSPAITRGAQNALDTHMESIRSEIQKQDFDLEMKIQTARGKGESTVGLDQEKRLNVINNRYKMKTASINKTAELQTFAWKKYKCRLELFYFVP